MLRLSVFAAIATLVAVAFTACGGSSSHSDASTPVTPNTTTAGSGGTAGFGGGTAGFGGGTAGFGGGTAGFGGGTAGQAAGGASGSAASGGSAQGTAGVSNSAGTQGSDAGSGLPSDGGVGWIPSDGGSGWDGPQDPACPAMETTNESLCSSPVGTRCTYPTGGTYTQRCQCYTASGGENRWWCQTHSSTGWDDCPLAYPGSGTCPNIGDVTCYYVEPQGTLAACNCSGGVALCQPWGI